MFLACSRTLDFASTMEEVPTAVDLKRTRGTFFDAAVRCIIFFVCGKKRKKEDGERTSYIERKREKGRDPAHNRGLYKHESEKNGVEAGTVLVSSSHVRDPAASLRFTGRPGAWCERGPGFILLKGYRD